MKNTWGKQVNPKPAEPERPSRDTIHERRKILAKRLREKNKPDQSPMSHQVPELTINGVAMTLKAVYE